MHFSNIIYCGAELLVNLKCTVDNEIISESDIGDLLIQNVGDIIEIFYVVKYEVISFSSIF